MERIYRDHVRAVDGYLRTAARASGHTHLARSVAVADLLQEIFIRAFSPTARANYDGTREFLPYLLAIARNCFFDALRVSGREVPRSTEELAELVEQNLQTPEPGPDARTINLLNAYLRDLPPALKAIYDQRFVRGNSQELSSAALGISRRAVRTAEARLTSGLRKALRRAGLNLHELARDGEDSSTRIPPVTVKQRG